MNLEELTIAYNAQTELLNTIQKELAEIKSVLIPIKLSQRSNLDAHRILLATAEHFKTEVSLLKSKSRVEPNVLARQVAMYILYEHKKLSFKEIGALFNRDHSSIVSGVERIKHSLATYKDLGTTIQAILSLAGDGSIK